MLRAHAQPLFAEQFGHFGHRARRVVAEIAHDGERLVDQHARAPFQAVERETRIGVAIVIRPADDDLRRLGIGRVEESPDPVCRRAELLHDLLELLDGLAGLRHRPFGFGKGNAQVDQLTL